MKSFITFVILACLVSSCNVQNKRERERLMKEKQQIEEGLRIFSEEKEKETGGVVGVYSMSTDTWKFSKRDANGNTIEWTEPGFNSPTNNKSIAYKVAEQSAKDRIKEIDDSLKMLE